MNLLTVLAIFGICFFLKETGGPFGIMSWLRGKLFNNKHVGVFFYQLFSCYFCLGCHAGYIVYLLSTPHHSWTVPDLVLWTLAGGSASFIINSILEKLSHEEN